MAKVKEKRELKMMAVPEEVHEDLQIAKQLLNQLPPQIITDAVREYLKPIQPWIKEIKDKMAEARKGL